MIYGRALIASIKDTKSRLERLGAEFDSDYKFKDIIYQKENTSLNEDFLRVRVYSKSSFGTKKVVLVNKKTGRTKTGKTETTPIKMEFDTEREADKYVKDNLSEYKQSFDYERVGWTYKLDNNRVFLEDIQSFRPSVEIEVEKDGDLKNLYDKLHVNKILSDTMPEIMRKIKKKK